MSNNATNDKGGPGIIGTKQPSKPNSNKTTQMITIIVVMKQKYKNILS